MNSGQGILQLPQALATRSIGTGIEILRANYKLTCSLSPNDEGSAVLVGYLAEWVDVGIADAALLKRVLRRYSPSLRATLPLADYLYLRAADGVVTMFEGEFERAIRHFSVVLALGDDIQDKALVAVLNFWTGRCLRHAGRYQDALNYVIRGRKCWRPGLRSKRTGPMRLSPFCGNQRRRYPIQTTTQLWETFNLCTDALRDDRAGSSRRLGTLKKQSSCIRKETCNIAMWHDHS